MDPLAAGLSALIPSAPTPLAALPPGSALTAIVQQILVPGQIYQVDVQGMLLDMQLKMMLEVGARVPMRVKESGPRGVVLTPVSVPTPPPSTPPPPADTPEQILRDASLPIRDDTVRAVRAIREIGARPTPDIVQTVAEAIRAAPPARPDLPPIARDAAAAFLVTRGLPATPAAIELTAPAFSVSPPREHAGPVPREFVEAVRPAPLDLTKPAPAPLEAVAEAVRAAPEALREVVAQAVARSPALPLLDAAIAEARLLQPTAAIPEAELMRILSDVVARILAAPDAPAVQQIVRALPPDPKLIARLLVALEEAEIAEIRRLPELRTLRARPDLTESAERAVAARAVNNTSALQGEGVTVIEVPIRSPELTRALLVFRRSNRKGASYEGFESFTVDVSMSRLGRVVGHVALSKQTAGVRFQVRGPAERRLFEAHEADLVAGLGALGLDATVSVGVRGESEPSLAEALRAQGSVSVDLKA